MASWHWAGLELGLRPAATRNKPTSARWPTAGPDLRKSSKPCRLAILPLNCLSASASLLGVG
eukprot:6288803-Alexandrium_andersonii.AAC.1